MTALSGPRAAVSATTGSSPASTTTAAWLAGRWSARAMSPLTGCSFSKSRTSPARSNGVKAAGSVVMRGVVTAPTYEPGDKPPSWPR
jgi:hypothetical protein